MLDRLKAIEGDPDRGILSIDLSDVAGDGAVLRFKEPRAADLFPDAKALGDLKLAFPEFPDAMLYQLHLLGRCYIPDPTDPAKESPIRAFGNLARKSKAVFFRIMGEFLAQYPIDSLDGRVEAVKNDSAE